MLLIALAAMAGQSPLIEAMAARRAYSYCLDDARTSLLVRRVTPAESAKQIAQMCAESRAAFIRTALAMQNGSGDRDEPADRAAAYLDSAIKKYRADYEGSKLPGE